MSAQIECDIPPIRTSHVVYLKKMGLTHNQILMLQNIVMYDEKYGELEKEITQNQWKYYSDLWGLLFQKEKTQIDAQDHNIEIKKTLEKILKKYKLLDENTKTLLEYTHQIGTYRFYSHGQIAAYIASLKKPIDIHLKCHKLRDEEVYQTGISKVQRYLTVDIEQRMMLEIQQRIINPSAFLGETEYGNLGANILAMLNVVKKGDPNPVSEFRNRMYFVYMLNDFVNELMEMDAWSIESINRYLLKKYQWSIDITFIRFLKERRKDIAYIPPLFRYGAYADLNNKILRKHAISRPHPEKLSLSRLSDREKIVLYGTSDPKNVDFFNHQEVIIYSGKNVFELILDPEILKSQGAVEPAIRYVEVIHQLGIPVITGISGTYDQSVTMANFVGLLNSQEHIKKICLVYIAFMVPNQDHTVHEILTSSKSFGVPYNASPLLHTKVLDETFAKEVDALMKEKHGFTIYEKIDEVRKKLPKVSSKAYLSR